MVLRILCLHGYRQDSKSFREKTGGFRKLLKNLEIEFVFMDSPNVIPKGDQNPDGLDSYRSWWFSENDPHESFFSLRQSNLAIGFDESLDAVRHEFETNGPFDGILGFSQGAAMTALICGLKQRSDFSPEFKFAILSAGFKSRSSLHESCYDTLIEVPTLHMMGESDQIIPKPVSQELVQVFKDPVVIYHPSGHMTPSSAAIRSDVIKFLTQFI